MKNEIYRVNKVSYFRFDLLKKTMREKWLILSFTNTKYSIPFICNTVDLDYFMVVWNHKLKTNPNLKNTVLITIKTVKLRQIHTC